ncbi:tetratricopeptide repeat protein [Terrabacter sp. 2YAF2]|uniref:tetratricopeptide repeat protein n=1 Tax=Terrabacter sp. 2YAF2 TaxID=3233026 RepID=UPI003F94AE2E
MSNIGLVHLRRSDLDTALRYYEQALPILREVGDRAGAATTLTNIGAVHHGRGDGESALRHLEQALPILREVGDRAGEAVTRFNVAMVLRGRGGLEQAIRELEQVVELDRAVQHPDLASDTAMLNQVRAELREQHRRYSDGQ